MRGGEGTSKARKGRAGKKRRVRKRKLRNPLILDGLSGVSLPDYEQPHFSLS